MNIFNIIILTVFISRIGFTQVPDKEEFHQAYYVGHKLIESIEVLEAEDVVDYFTDTTNLEELFYQVKLNLNDTTIKQNEEVVYNRETRLFEFYVYAGRIVPDGSDWGLFEYSFSLKLCIRPNKENSRIDQIISTNVNIDIVDIKTWWQSLMVTYEDLKYCRNEIALIYGWIPPPPPMDTEWLKK